MMPKLTYAITGVTSGIGAELARILKHQGHHVIGFDVRETSENVDQFIHLDLNDPDSISSAAAQVTTPLNGLCNNAGLPPRDGLEETILQVNFLGTRDFTAAMVPHLHKGASIVNMASRAGQHWRAGLDQVKRLARLTDRSQLTGFIRAEGIDATRCYNLTKEAVILWTAAESEAMANLGLRVNSLSPAAVSTGILVDFQKAFGDKVARNLERAGRAGTPEEIAQIAAFVLSPASNWIKGADIPIDGGMGAFSQSDALELDVLRLNFAENPA
jgi:NAD(P)-dependent dehydrogenase (short-subunit alcohol dehydrogenase family)